MNSYYELQKENMIMNSYATFHDLRIQIWIHIYNEYCEIIPENMGTNVPDMQRNLFRFFLSFKYPVSINLDMNPFILMYRIENRMSLEQSAYSNPIKFGVPVKTQAVNAAASILRQYSHKLTIWCAEIQPQALNEIED